MPTVKTGEIARTTWWNGTVTKSLHRGSVGRIDCSGAGLQGRIGDGNVGRVEDGEGS